MITRTHLRILFLINNLGMGGAERVFIRDINALAAEGYDVSIGFMYPNREDAKSLPPLTISHDHIFSFGFRSLYDIAGFRRLVAILRKNEIELVYSTLDEANIVSRIAKLFVPKLKVYVREANVGNTKPLQFKIADILLNVLSRKIVACSPIVGTTVAAYQPFHKGKFIVLENGVDIPPDMPQRPLKNGVDILTVGSLDPKKRHAFLLRSVARLKGIDFSWRLLIVGSGPLEHGLKELVRNLNLSNNVQFLGQMSKGDVEALYRSADIFVFTPQWEGGPNVLLEAMSYGLPSVVTRLVGEKVEDGITGFLVDYNNEKALAERLTQLARDPVLRNTMGLAARAKVIRENSIDAHIRQLHTVLELDRV